MLDSWKFVIEVHWAVRAPLVFVRYRACFLGGDRYGEIFLGFARSCTKPPPLGGMEPHGIPVVHTCRLPTFVGTGLSWFYFMFFGEWSKLLIDDGLWWVGSDSSLWVCWDQLHPSFRPWVTVVRMSPTSPSEMDVLHFIISSMFFGLEFTDKLECMDH